MPRTNTTIAPESRTRQAGHVAVELSNRRLPARMRLGRIQNAMRIVAFRGRRTRQIIPTATAGVAKR